MKRDVRKPPKFDVFLNPAKKEDQESIERAMTLKFRLIIRKNDHFKVLLLKGEFYNNCNPKRCLHKSEHIQTNAL